MRQILTILFLIAISSVSALAWDDTGHKITGYIAWQNMTPAAREKAVALLLQAPEDSGILNLLATDSRPTAARQEWMFVTMATWADLVRDRNFPIRNKEYNHGTWHYTDTYFRDNNGKTEIVNDLKPDAENAVERLFALEKIVKDTSKPNAERAVALAWILHIAGDIHQPLHAVSRVTDVEPKGDQGGNAFSLSPADAPKEKRENLHYFWDSIVTRSITRQNQTECDPNYIPRLADDLTKQFPSSKFAANLKAGKYDEWQRESFDLATREVYKGIERNKPASEDYRKRALTISNERLALAGYRMAELLNRIFV